MWHEVPFPVGEPYRVRPDLQRLDGPPFRLDGAWPAYAAEKLHLLRAAPERARVLDPQRDGPRLGGTVEALAHLIARQLPDAVRADGEDWAFPRLGVRLVGAERAPEPAHEGVRLEALAELDAEAPEPRQGAPLRETAVLLAQIALRHLRPLDPVERLLDAVALAVQEDLVVMRTEGGEGPGRAELLHVCFPSHWDPAARAGASLAELHGPVPHGQRLRDAGPQLLRAMTELGPYQRFVWGLEPSFALDRHPSAPTPAWPDDPRTLPDRVAFRVERQTTHPLADGRALFTIRVYVASLRTVLKGHPDRARRLAGALRSMDEPLLAYKGLTGRRELVLDALERLSSAPAGGGSGSSSGRGGPSSGESGGS